MGRRHENVAIYVMEYMKIIQVQQIQRPLSSSLSLWNNCSQIFSLINHTLFNINASMLAHIKATPPPKKKKTLFFCFFFFISLSRAIRVMSWLSIINSHLSFLGGQGAQPALCSWCTSTLLKLLTCQKLICVSAVFLLMFTACIHFRNYVHQKYYWLAENNKDRWRNVY